MPETKPRNKHCMQSRHRKPEANQCRRHVLSGWNCAIRHLERCMCLGGKDQTENQWGSLSIWSEPGREKAKVKECSLHSVKPADFPSKVIRYSTWLRRLQAIPHRVTVNIDESLTKGFDRPWTTWRCLNRLHTWFTCSKEQRQRWRYYEGDTTCECSLATENTAHMMQCILLAQPCSLDDLNKFNDTAKKCVERWKTLVWWHKDDDGS